MLQSIYLGVGVQLLQKSTNPSSLALLADLQALGASLPGSSFGRELVLGKTACV